MAARHCLLNGYQVHLFIPRPLREDLRNLWLSCSSLGAIVEENLDSLGSFDLIVDSLLGFGFTPPIRNDMKQIINKMISFQQLVLSVDIPSGWDADREMENAFQPKFLVSIMVPKVCSTSFKGRHFLGGNFLVSQMAGEYGLFAGRFEEFENLCEIGSCDS